MVSNVQSLKASHIVVWTKLSVFVSIAAVASSSIKICKEMWNGYKETSYGK